MVACGPQQPQRPRKPAPASAASSESDVGASLLQRTTSGQPIDERHQLQPQQVATPTLPLALVGAVGVAGVAIMADVFLPGSLHILAPIDVGAHTWVAANLDSWTRKVLAGYFISDAFIAIGVVGWAVSLIIAVTTRDPRLIRASGCAGLLYVLGGGSIQNADTVLVAFIKGMFDRPRPSNVHASFSFPSGHTTSATFICGVLFFLLIPLALQALEDLRVRMLREQEAQQGQQGGPQEAERKRKLFSRWRKALLQTSRYVAGNRWQTWLIAAATTASGRVLNDAHWASDTMAGFCLGFLLTAATLSLSSKIEDWVVDHEASKEN